MNEIQKHENVKDEIMAAGWIVLGLFIFFVSCGAFVIFAVAWE